MTDIIGTIKMNDYVTEWMDWAKFMVHLADDFPDDWKSKKVPGSAVRRAVHEPKVKEKWCQL